MTHETSPDTPRERALAASVAPDAEIHLSVEEIERLWNGEDSC